MVSRIHHWSSRGFLYLLGKLCDKGDAQFREWYRFYDDERHANLTFSPSKHKDEGLQAYLQKLAPDSHFTHNHPFATGTDLSRLYHAYATKDTAYDRYQADIAFIFHQLFVSANCIHQGKLIDFNNKINLFKSKNFKDNGFNRSELVSAARAVFTSANFLWQITGSKMFAYHIDMLSVNGQLAIPIGADRTKYAEGFKLLPHPSQLTVSESDDLEIGLLPSNSATYGNNKSAYMNWARLHVSHFLAITVLEDFSRTSNILVELVEAPRPSSTDSVEPWEITIERTVNDPNLSVESKPEMTSRFVDATKKVLAPENERIVKEPAEEASPNFKSK